MADMTEKNLRRVEVAINKLRNKLKRADLDYTVQISISSTDPTLVRYAAQMTPPANGLAPVTYLADSIDELIEKIKLSSKGIDYDAVERAYHEAQIEACKRTIQSHEERISELARPAEERSVHGQPTEESTEEPVDEPTDSPV